MSEKEEQDCLTQDEDEDEDDDDIPDLESVDSSEYYSDDEIDNTLVNDQPAEPHSANFSIALNWLAKYKGKDLQKEYEILTIYIYSPFLYGDHIDPYHWESQWFSWFRKVNLISQRHFSTEQLSLQEIRVLEILGLTLDWSWRQFVFLEKVSYLEWVMDLWEEVDGKKDIDRVIEEVKEKNWFNEILEMISTQPVDLRLNNSELKNPLAIELCVLYAVCHLGYQLKTRKDNVTSFQDEMKANMQRAHENHKQEIDANLENAEMSFLMCERLENVELYNKAIRLSPFDVKLYESRLKANFLTSYYQDAASDSMRILCLQKDHKIAHLCLIKSLKELNEVTRAEIATRLFYTYYPSSIDRDSLQELLANSGRDLFTIDCPIPPNSIREYEKLNSLGLKGTECFRSGDYENAQLFYGVCLSKAREIPTWRHALSWKDGLIFLLSVQYSYAQSLLLMKKYEAGLDAFLKLRRYHKVYSFPAAHLFAATCYIRLKRYMEASENIETGMGLCGLQDNISLLHWPGTGDVIEECLLRSIKVEFERLQIQVAQKMEAIGSCCFASCTSKQITRVGPGFEGYCVLKCSENCTLMFHHNCWKKEKEAIGCIKDKNVISINCLTSDCPGVIIYAVLYDMDERPRFEIGEQTSSNFKKQCKSLGGVGGMSSLSRTSSSSSCELNNKGKKQEELDNTKGQDNDVTTDVAKQPIDAPPTKQNLIIEDVRKSEDSVVVINRQTEEKESKPAAKSKNKKKRNKQTTKEDPEVPTQIGCKWDDLFILPERGGRVNENGISEGVKWEPDPEAPFATPSYLVEKVSKFEAEELPNILDTMSSTHKLCPPNDVPIDSSDYDFAITYFEEIFKNDGPILDPKDTVLIEGLELIQDECKKIINSFNGLDNFLLSSSKFKRHGETKIQLRNLELHANFPQFIKQVDNELSNSTWQKVNGTSSKNNNRKGKKKKEIVQQQLQIVRNGHDEVVIKTAQLDDFESSSFLVDEEVKKKEKEKVKRCDIGIQTTANDKSVASKAINTDALPAVETFKESYEDAKIQLEKALKEKKSLEFKLETSEDARVKLQRQHSREIDKITKKVKSETKKECDDKLSRVLKEEKDKFSKERRDLNDVLKATKSDVKLLNEKLNKLKKDLAKKEKEKHDLSFILQEQQESFHKQRESQEEEYEVKLQQIKERAIEGEVMLLTHRQESSVKPMEQRLQELEKLCAFASQIVPGGDTDLSLFKDQLKQAVETYKVSTDEQIDQIRKEVKELNQLTLIPSLHSQCPMSPQLIMRAQLMQRKLATVQRGLMTLPSTSTTASVSTITSNNSTSGSDSNAGPPGNNILPTSGSNTLPPSGSITGPPGSITGPPGSITGPPGSITGPPGSITGPAGNNTGPPGSITGPAGSITGPAGSITGPPGSITGPPGSITGPPGSITGPPGSITGPPGSIVGPAGSNTVGPAGSNSGGPPGLSSDMSTNGYDALMSSNLTKQQQQQQQQQQLPNVMLELLNQTVLSNVQDNNVMGLPQVNNIGSSNISSQTSNLVLPQMGLPQTSNLRLPQTSSFSNFGPSQANNLGLPQTSSFSNLGQPQTSNFSNFELSQTSNLRLPQTSSSFSNLGQPQTSNFSNFELSQASNLGLPQTSMRLPQTSNWELSQFGNLGLPQAQTSNLGLPQAQTSNLGLPQAQTSNLGLPQAQTSNLGLPQAQTSNLGLPQAQTSNLGLPQAQTSNLGLPQAQTSNLGLYQLSQMSGLHNSGLPQTNSLLSQMGLSQTYNLEQYQLNNLELSQIGNLGLPQAQTSNLGLPQAQASNLGLFHTNSLGSNMLPSLNPPSFYNQHLTNNTTIDSIDMAPIGGGGGGMSLEEQIRLRSNVSATSSDSSGKRESINKGGNEKGNFDQLVATLSPRYPSYKRDDFKRAVLDLRQKTSLTGLPLDQVIEKVREIIDEKERNQQNVTNHMTGPNTKFPQMAKLRSNSIDYSNEDNNCIICYEDMKTNDSLKLECGHRFHSHCIKSWLNEQSTCPTCRTHALLTDDFPRLQTVHNF